MLSPFRQTYRLVSYLVLTDRIGKLHLDYNPKVYKLFNKDYFYLFLNILKSMLSFSKDFPPDKLLRNTASHSFKTILFQGGNQEHQASQKPAD